MAICVINVNYIDNSCQRISNHKLFIYISKYKDNTFDGYLFFSINLNKTKLQCKRNCGYIIFN